MRHKRADALCVATYVAQKFCQPYPYECPEILEILVFGSTAQGKQEVSDVDILIVYLLTDECEYADPIENRFKLINEGISDKQLPNIRIDFNRLSVSYFKDESIRNEYRRFVFRDPDFVEKALSICLRWNRTKQQFLLSNLAEIKEAFSQLPASA